VLRRLCADSHLVGREPALAPYATRGGPSDFAVAYVTRPRVEGVALPAGQPDRPVAAFLLFLPLVAGLSLVVISLRDGDLPRALTFALLTAVNAALMRHFWRRDFGSNNEG
jgi:hypothetical protein